MKFELLFFTCIFAGYLNAQSNPTSKVESIGFAYGVIAGKSEVFVQVEEYLNNKDYDEIIKLLESDTASDVFVGSLICKILLERNKISSTAEQENRLNENFNSQLPLVIRSGCTCSLKVSIKDLFDGVDACNFSFGMAKWLNELIH